MLPDETTQEEQQAPFQPADPNPSDSGNGGAADLPTDHPATDADLDKHELYDEGVAGAAEVEDPEVDTTIEDTAL